MDKKETLAALSALAHESRLDAFRLLVQAGSEGLAAGEIASRLDALGNTTSTNLGILARTGLIDSQREGRSVRYFASYARMTDLLRFLMLDCCRGEPEVVEPLVSSLCRKPAGEAP